MAADGTSWESEALTRGVRVRVAARYDPGRSAPTRGRWFFLYTVVISNEGDQPVQLVTRHWVITDETGKVEEVRGPGVVGEQPRLEPGESFRYTSGCPLATAFGTMHGSYGMIGPGGERFDAEIPAFTLAEPYSIQ